MWRMSFIYRFTKDTKRPLDGFQVVVDSGPYVVQNHVGALFQDVLIA
jgi:hypothetical protein